MSIEEQIKKRWAAHQKEIETVWWLLPGYGQVALADSFATKLQARITARLLMTPFTPEAGQSVGAELAHQFSFHLEKLGQLQQLLAEQLLAALEPEQVAWLAPRLTAFWAEMTIGYGVVLRELYATEQTVLREKLLLERQQMMKQAAESESRFAALFENTDNPALIQKNGRVLAINKAMTNVFGYSEEMLVGKAVQTLIDTFTPLAEREKILARIQAGDEQPYRTYCFTQDGTVVAVEIVPQHVSADERLTYMIVLQRIDESDDSLLASPETTLSPRQQTVLAYMATELTYKEIAQKLGLSSATVHYHRGKIFEKLQVNTRVEAVLRASQNP